MLSNKRKASTLVNPADVTRKAKAAKGDSRSNQQNPPEKLNFQSKDLEELLNVIDDLRAHGISRYIDLPQLIVCGDQSSGKSSVLEAVSGLKFPTKDNLCTRFPTELALRRNPVPDFKVTIIPDDGRTDDEKMQLAQFRRDIDDLQDFSSIIAAASDAMGLDTGHKVFSNDVLRIELTGPKLPHVTLVDLPGLFHSGNRNQSDKDAQTVKDLVTDYMEKSRSIILAVISAKNDYANQIVTKYAKEVDPNGERTMGIITKPDTLHVGSGSEQQFFELAENKDTNLRLGWHVLKNRDFDNRNSTTRERDQAEIEFFSTGIWTTLKSTQVGIKSLKPKLSRILRTQILHELPGLIKDVASAIKDCEARLAKLGGSRHTSQQQRLHLHRVSQDYCRLIDHAIQGHYHDPYFHDTRGISGDHKRIRAVVFNILDDFSSDIKRHGHHYEVVESDGHTSAGQQFPILITRARRLKEVKRLMKKNRGYELPGTPTSAVIALLFRDQCSPWEDIARSYTATIFEAVRDALYAALNKAADASTRDGVLRHILDPALEELRRDLDTRVQRNLHNHTLGQPMTFNNSYTDSIQRTRMEQDRARVEERLLKALGIPESSADTAVPRTVTVSTLAEGVTYRTLEETDKFACSEALFRMEAYYEVALNFFIDDFCIHTIEEGLVSKLQAIFQPSSALELEEAIIEEIAGETEESKIERDNSSKKLAVLKQASQILQKLDKGHYKGKL